MRVGRLCYWISTSNFVWFLFRDNASESNIFMGINWNGTSVDDDKQQVHFQACTHTQNFFQNLIESTQNPIVFTILRLILNQTDVRLVPNQSGNDKYILTSGWFNKIPNIFLYVYTFDGCCSSPVEKVLCMKLLFFPPLVFFFFSHLTAALIDLINEMLQQWIWRSFIPRTSLCKNASDQTFERLASLGKIRDQLRALLKPSVHHSTIIYGGLLIGLIHVERRLMSP